MAITRVAGQSTSGTQLSGTSLVLTLTNNPTQNRLVVAELVDSTGTAPPAYTVKDSNNNSYTATPSTVAVDGFNDALGIYYLVAPANATKTITISWTGTRTFVSGFVREYDGAATSSVFSTDATDVAGGHSGNAINTPQITPPEANDLVVFCATANVTISSTPPAGWTLVGAIENGTSGASDQIQTTATLTPATATGALTTTNANWTSMLAAFKVAPAAAAAEVGRKQGALFTPGRGPSKSLRSLKAYPPAIIVPTLNIPQRRFIHR